MLFFKIKEGQAVTKAWIKAYFLRTVKRPAIIAAVLVMAAVSVLLTLSSKSDMSGFACGMLNSDDEKVLAVFEELKNENSILDIIIYDDEEEMLKSQRRSEIRFAYVFDSEFTEKYEDGESRRTIVRFSDEDDIFASLADELVFAKVASVYAEASIEQFANTNKEIDDEYREEVKETALVMYEEYMDILGDVFVYETGGGAVVSSNGGSAAFPIRGVMSMLVLAASLLGMQTVLSDEEKSLFLRLSPKNKNFARLMGILMPTLLVAAALLVCVALNGIFTNVLYEILSVLLLAACSASFAFFVSAFIKDPDSAAMLIPLLLLISLALCPVFFDISAIVKGVKYVGALLPPYYYLYAASQNSGAMAGSLIMTVVYLSGGLLLRRIKNT